jgi:large subunit ribosomal protein L17
MALIEFVKADDPGYKSTKKSAKVKRAKAAKISTAPAEIAPAPALEGEAKA